MLKSLLLKVLGQQFATVMPGQSTRRRRRGGGTKSQGAATSAAALSMEELNTGKVQHLPSEPEDGNEPGAALQIAEYIASKEADGIVFEQDDRDMVAFLWVVIDGHRSRRFVCQASSSFGQ